MPIDPDGSLIDGRGRLRHFSRHAFEKLAANRGRCFICGADRSLVDFNDEHVIPDWLLRRFDLHSRRVTLPNSAQQLYGRYKLRCCTPCNTLLGSTIEKRVSKLFTDDAESSVDNLKNADPSFLYCWLCLVFIKILLKDREFRADLDRRIPSSMIGDMYDWDGLQHIHSVARIPHSEATVDSAVIGTTYIFEMYGGQEKFDFCTISDYSTLMIRIGSLGIAAVLNDGGCVSAAVHDYLSHISGPLSSIQLREVAAHLAYGNKRLVSRPWFWTELAHEKTVTIRSGAPSQLEFRDVDLSELGELIAFSCAPLMRNSQMPNLDEAIEYIKLGKAQFLYRADGSFISNSL